VESTGQYEAGYNPVFIGVNALRNYDMQAGSGNFLYGWTADAGITPTRSGGSQTFTRATSANTFGKTNALFFPYVGETITMSVFLSTAGASNEIGLRFLDDSGVIISDVVDNPSASGTFGVTATVPAGTFLVQVIVNPGDVASDTVIFTNPSLRIGTSTTYTNF
jgi:hypothetical protein